MLARQMLITIASAISDNFPKMDTSFEVPNIIEFTILDRNSNTNCARKTALQWLDSLIKLNMPIEVLSELVHLHPFIVEGVQECVRMLLNTSIFKSSVFKDKLACYSLVDGVKTHLDRL
jgi:hypothetical protein